jgi:hypothetical protein
LIAALAAVSTATVSQVSSHGAPLRERQNHRTVRLNGFEFRIPKSHRSIPSEVVDTVFIFSKKHAEGFFLTVPSGKMDETELLNRNTEIALKKFFPELSQDYAWRPLSDRRKVSKFEVGTSKAMGFNKRDLVIVQVHHFQINGKEIFVGDLFKWTNGNEKEIFAGGLGGESMQGCNDLVEIVYSVTREKIDDTNSPCELIAILPQ